jgi:hypothetical protein
MKRRAPHELETGLARPDSEAAVCADEAQNVENGSARSIASALSVEPDSKQTQPILHKRRGLPPLKPTASCRPGISSFENSFERKRDAVNLRVAKLLESYLDTVLDQDQVPNNVTACDAALSASMTTSKAGCCGDESVLSRGALSEDGRHRNVSADVVRKEAVDTFRLFEDSPCGVMKVDSASKDGNSRPDLRGPKLGCAAPDDVNGPDEPGVSRGRKRRRKLEPSFVSSQAHEECGLPITTNPSTSQSSSSSEDDSVERRVKLASVVVEIVPYSGIS